MSRRRARQEALEVLYEADARQEPIKATLSQKVAFDVYAAALASGVDDHRMAIDDLIASHARGWDLDHMPTVDRNVLRLALYELLWSDVPDAVIIDEAVELAKRFSTDEAARFVNGVLSAVASGEGRTRR